MTAAREKLWDAWDAINEADEHAPNARDLWLNALRLLPELSTEEREQETQPLVEWGALHGWLDGADVDAEIEALLRA